MNELATILISASIGFAGSALLMYIRDIYLYGKRTKEQHRRTIIERRLEKLYSPLYRNIKTSEFLFKQQTLSSVTTQGKQELDSIIDNGLYLAEDELMKLLPRIYGAGYYQEANKEIVGQIVKLITNSYERLRKDYFAFGNIDPNK